MRMLIRLGRVLYWTACGIAAILGLAGIALGIAALNASPADRGGMLFFAGMTFLLGVLVFLIGLAIRYVIIGPEQKAVPRQRRTPQFIETDQYDDPEHEEDQLPPYQAPASRKKLDPRWSLWKAAGIGVILAGTAFALNLQDNMKSASQSLTMGGSIAYVVSYFAGIVAICVAFALVRNLIFARKKKPV
jgi:hypothetical protein